MQDLPHVFKLGKGPEHCPCKRLTTFFDPPVDNSVDKLRHAV